MTQHNCNAIIKSSQNRDEGGDEMINTQKLKAAIVAAGYTQGDVARMMRLSENTFSAKLNGKKRFYIGEAAVLCEILHIDDCAERCKIFLN